MTPMEAVTGKMSPSQQSSDAQIIAAFEEALKPLAARLEKLEKQLAAKPATATVRPSAKPAAAAKPAEPMRASHPGGGGGFEAEQKRKGLRERPRLGGIHR